MLSEAQRFWEAIAGKVKQTAKEVSKNAFRCERYTVTTAPNGLKMGVTLPMGNTELMLPYSSEVASATVGDTVLVVWWGSMSNAKVYYFSNGYVGANGGLAAYPVGSYYWSSSSTSPALLFGGTWEQVKDKFVLAAGDTYTVNSTGGEATHTLIVNEMPSHKHQWQGYWTINKGASGQAVTARGRDWQAGDPLEDVTTLTGGGQAHNNMPPYIVAYCWHRVA